jgi:hypothetical protein
MTTFTYTKPTVGGSEDTWGDTLNANWDAVAAFIGPLDSTELAVLDGITASTAELNLLDGVTVALADITATATEINYVSGVTSPIQTQIDNLPAPPELTQVQVEDDTSTVFGQVSGQRLGQAVAANGLGGSEQTWQDMTASRAASTSYQNTTGGPISVSITQGVPRYFQISTDNVTWFNLGKFADATSKPSAHFFIIPDLIYYRINGSVTLLEWWELR